MESRRLFTEKIMKKSEIFAENFFHKENWEPIELDEENAEPI